MTVGDMLGGGARLVRTQPKALALWALLYLAAAGATAAMFWPMMTEMAAFQRQMATGRVDPAAAPPPVPGLMGGAFLMELVLLVVIAAIFAAAVRAVASGRDDRFGHLRLGMDELRLIGLGILLWLMLVVGMVVVTVVGVVLTAILSAAFGGAVMPVVMVPLSIAVMALLLWAHVRLSLAGAFTVLRGRITIRPAWRATRGQFWTLFGAFLAIGVVYIVVTILFTAIVFPELLGAYATMLGSPDPQAVIAFQQAMIASLFGPRMIVAMVAGALVNTVLIGWLFGAVATAAVTLDPESRA